MKAIPFLLVLTAGALLGSLLTSLFRSPAILPPDTAASEPGEQAAGKIRHRTPSPNPAVEAELRRIAEALPGNFPVDYKHWSFADLKVLALGLLSQTDPIEGLPDEKRDILDRIILSMARQDRDGTLAWIDGELPSLRFRLTSKVVRDSMSDSPPIECVEFFRSRNFSKEEVGDFAGSQFLRGRSYAPGIDTEAALYLLALSNASYHSATGGSTNFAPNFDFKRFAEAVATKATADGNKPPNCFPTNFLEEWARVSPQEAVEFYFTRCTGKDPLQLPFNEMENLLSGVRSAIPGEQYASWLGETIWQQFEGGKPDEDAIRKMISLELAHPEVLATALGAIKDPAIKSNLLFDALRYSAEQAPFGGDGSIKLRSTLSLYADPGERLDRAGQFARELGQRRGDPDQGKLIDALCLQLGNLGHSEAEIQGIRTAAKP